eukprot:TRINITY_DN696_c0_g2_i2.p1 TRINITY_DN696_c0_g2~~TRINITY_DN696_c0_g2_i2.p1  ORF type:complete len:813 (+),score=306.33 TRINITY_DN696_c0_g2_i2:18-2456(+)
MDTETKLPILTLSSSESELYAKLFSLADSDQDGYISTSEAGFFLKSGLDKTQLAAVWNMVNENNPSFGKLNKNSFAVTLRLISLIQSGKIPTLQLAATSNDLPLPRFMLEPSSAQTSSSTSTPQLVISDQLKSSYKSIFDKFPKSNPNLLTGIEARDYLAKSNLPPNELSKIWSLSDIDGDGALNVHEFYICMFLIQRKLSAMNQPLPSTLPPSLIQSARSSDHVTTTPPPTTTTTTATQPSNIHTITTTPPSTNMIGQAPQPPTTTTTTTATTSFDNSGGSWWIIPSDKKVVFEKYFAQADPQRTGFISGQVARDLFSRSGLTTNDLSLIWKLSDMNNDGKLDKHEFTIAMHLIDCKRTKGSDFKIPTQLHPSLLLLQQSSSGIGVGVGVGVGGGGGIFSLPTSQADLLALKQREEKERIERERIERERIEREKSERERLERERIEKERMERDRLERERLERERIERERLEEIERENTNNLKNQIIVKLNMKSQLISSLRSIQSNNIDVAQKISVKEQLNLRELEVLRSLELTVERQNICSLILNEKYNNLKNQLAIMHERKKILEKLFGERKQQFTEEETKFQLLADRLTEEKLDVEKQKEQIVILQAQLDAAKTEKHILLQKKQLEKSSKSHNTIDVQHSSQSTRSTTMTTTTTTISTQKEDVSSMQPDQYYELYHDDFGTKKDTLLPLSTTAVANILFYGPHHPRFPTDFYPETDYGKLISITKEDLTAQTDVEVAGGLQGHGGEGDHHHHGTRTDILDAGFGILTGGGGAVFTTDSSGATNTTDDTAGSATVDFNPFADGDTIFNDD